MLFRCPAKGIIGISSTSIKSPTRLSYPKSSHRIVPFQFSRPPLAVLLDTPPPLAVLLALPVSPPLPPSPPSPGEAQPRSGRCSPVEFVCLHHREERRLRLAYLLLHGLQHRWGKTYNPFSASLASSLPPLLHFLWCSSQGFFLNRL